ncbi:P-loop containing nucleoside triphosphate hydrolase protein [Scleroderma yunnanense]
MGMLPDRTGCNPYVIVVVGRTGVGVSSLVNLIAGRTVAPHFPDASQCTRRIRAYPAEIKGTSYLLYDIPGFDGKVSTERLVNAIRTVERRRGVDLLLYCVRGKRNTFMPKTYRELRQTIPRVVPSVVVVTGLERYGGSEMVEWWSAIPREGATTTQSNGSHLEELLFEDHVCVTTLPELDAVADGALRERRDLSAVEVKRIISHHCEGLKRPGSGRPTAWDFLEVLAEWFKWH